jgi:hypothetical protein
MHGVRLHALPATLFALLSQAARRRSLLSGSGYHVRSLLSGSGYHVGSGSRRRAMGYRR